MAMPFEVYTDHYALQWLKTMWTGSALLHHWSAALEEYDFTVKHRPGKAHTHVYGLSQLPVDPAPPEDVLLHIRLLENEEEARKLTKELYSATHLGGQALWKFFCDRYDYKVGRRICLEVAQSCSQCQMGSDCGHRQKMTGAFQSRRPWDTLSINIVGPLPADHRQEFLIVFVDCYSRYTILIPSSNYTANTVSEALLRHVVPYFGTPRRLLSDWGREFASKIWRKLLRSLGIQRVLTSPYHPEGYAINERSHRTPNNMLRARLLEGSSSKAWVDKAPGIMLSLNAMPHESHGFSASMVTTGREPTLPPDVQQDVHASPAVDDPSEYVEAITQRLQLTHQQMASPSPPSVANPYQEGNLIFAMTTPPERASKLSPRWKGPFRICRIPNDYQIVYEDGEVRRTIHVNHAKPTKFTVPQVLKSLWPLLRLLIPPFWIFTSRPPRTSSSSSCISRTYRGLLLLFHNSINRPSANRSHWERDAAARNRASQSAARTRSSSTTISQTQPWAWPGVCYKRPTRKPTSPVWKCSQDSQDLSFYCALQPVSRCPHWSVCQPALSGPQKRSKPVFEYFTAAGRRSAQNGRPLLALRAPRSHLSPRPETPAALDAGSDLVTVAVWWPLSLRRWLPPVLSHTPGMACGLTRGWCDPAALGKVSELGPWPCSSSHSIPWWSDLPCTFREPRKYAATRRLSQASTEVTALSA